MPTLLIALVVVAGMNPGLALAQEDELDALFSCPDAEGRERFELCNVCRPMFLVIEMLSTDSVSGLKLSATTWTRGSTGTHGRNPGFIVQSVSEHVDAFLVEYLRVNEKDCRDR